MRESDLTDSLGANAACYVCHVAFVTEQLSQTHLRANVTCINCHGLSAGHANDEKIGATPPDVSFTRDQVGPMCLKCHKDRDTSPKDVPVPKPPPVCTDCHGKHRIAKPAFVSAKTREEHDIEKSKIKMQNVKLRKSSTIRLADSTILIFDFCNFL